jgi:CubicO group peptidase (beta-lactamase class C family)
MKLPLRLLLLFFFPAASLSGQVMVSGGRTDPARERLDSTMRAFEANGFSGAVRVDKNGTTYLEHGYGLANRAEKIRFSPATVVQIGSNTKDFTAVAILQLVERGKLSLSDGIGRFFHGAPADKRAITIAQLMDHRAGFPLGLGGDFEKVSRQALIDSAMRTKLLFPPGSRISYSNTGFSLLAAIIEQVSGNSYDIYVRDNILAPLGLKRTGFLLPRFAMRELAHGYRADGADAGTMLAKPHAPDGPYWNLRGNGAMLSTLDDMHAFYRALFETEKLMKASTRALRFHPNEPIGLAGSDGVNFFLYDRDPIARTEMIIASTNAAMKAPVVRRGFARILGLPVDVDGPPGGASSGAKRPAPAPVAQVVTGFFAVLNSGDKSAIRNFVMAHFAFDPGSPPLEGRLERMSQIHTNQGSITIKSMGMANPGLVELAASSSVNGPMTLRIQIDSVAPWKIHGIMVLAGGD